MTLQRDLEIFLRAFREANDALVVFDPVSLKLLKLNPAALRMTGLEHEAALALRLDGLLSSTDPALFEQLLEACREPDPFPSKEGYHLASKGGPPIPVSVSLSRIDTTPEPLALAILGDLSARKKVEEELRVVRGELETRVQARTFELLQAKETAESAGRVKDRFLAVLSHELRTPLTPVLAVVSALLNEPSTPSSLRPTLEMIRRSIGLEARLIDDLLDLTRFKDGEVPLERQAVDAHALIAQAIEVSRAEAEAAGVGLHLELSARAAIVEADSNRLLQVLDNLIQNGVKFTNPGGTIALRTSDAPDGRLVISVSDNGQGIAPEALSAIFEPFEQGTQANRRNQGGLGLGLSISRSIVKAHGGTLSVASEGIGRGSCFTLELPGARPSTSRDPAIESSKNPPASASPAWKILLVEDNKDVLRYLRIVLEMQGHLVTPAENLARARAASKGSFDLLISDIQLPDGSGLELMTELRGKLPGLAISGFSSADDIRMSLEAGFSLHLTKPLEIGRIEAAMREVIAGFYAEAG